MLRHYDDKVIAMAGENNAAILRMYPEINFSLFQIFFYDVNEDKSTAVVK